MMASAVVELQKVTRDFGGVRAVDAMDLAILEGEFLSLLGPSGCGKTTTLNLVAGFVEPTGGRILIDGEDVTGLPAHRRGLGVVFQSYALFPHLSVFENVACGLRERKIITRNEVVRVLGDVRGQKFPSGIGTRPRGVIASRVPLNLRQGEKTLCPVVGIGRRW